jgi:protein transport protein SEC13
MDIHKETIHSIERDIYEKKIITSSSDGIIRIFENINDPDQGINLKLEQELNSDSGIPTKAIFVNYNEIIASAYQSGKIILWKKNTSGYTKVLEKEVCNGQVNDISSSIDNDLIKIYCGCSDGKIRILKFDANMNMTEDEVMAHRFGISCIDSVAKYVVSGGLDYSLVVLEDDKEISRFRDHKSLIRDISIAPDNVFNILCFASCGDNVVYIYWRNGDEFMKQMIEFDESVYSLSWSRSGFTLSVGYGKNKFKCYEPGKEGKYEEVEIVREN